eukprot:TRINITY_DN14407_c0_g1_i1.p1 TRINITY_DN14407_c0_g1~~TRINITY_DN14407_c0_g1_i1.p1  ORF type:complete len:434 (+),score=67.96 TRINITY_DN14407_c0_g1_i1:56-1357(+)
MGQQESHCQDGRCQMGQCSKGPDVLTQLITPTGIFKNASNSVAAEEDPVYHGSLDASCLKDGHGLLMLPDGSWYDGQFRKDKKSGHGVYHYRKGSNYRGQWLDDQQHGQGRECWADGSTFEGQFAKGKKHGRGRFQWKSGCTYEGQFHRNDMHGTGSYTFADGQEYSGEWICNSMGPSGKMSWPDGRVYEGEFSGGMKHGNGKLSWPDGRCYEGQWVSDRQHGRGLARGGRGQLCSSIWENGRFVRWVVEPLEGSFLNDERQDVNNYANMAFAEEAAESCQGEQTRESNAHMAEQLATKNCPAGFAPEIVAEMAGDRETGVDRTETSTNAAGCATATVPLTTSDGTCNGNDIRPANLDIAEEFRSVAAEGHTGPANIQVRCLHAEPVISVYCDELSETEQDVQAQIPGDSMDAHPEVSPGTEADTEARLTDQF